MSNRETNTVVEYRGRTAVLTLNRPWALNTLSIAAIRELTTEFERLAGLDEIAVIVLRGLGDAFAAGADIKELLELDTLTAVDFSRLGYALFNAMRRSPLLIIAAIDGYCMGGGLDLALSCDLRYASTDAVLAHPGSKIGIITGFGGTRCLSSAIGEQSAEEMFATAERIDGLRAYEIGLVQALAVKSSAYELALERADAIAHQGRSRIARFKTLTKLASQIKQPHRDLLAKRFIELCRIAECGLTATD